MFLLLKFLLRLLVTQLSKDTSLQLSKRHFTKGMNEKNEEVLSVKKNRNRDIFGNLIRYPLCENCDVYTNPYIGQLPNGEECLMCYFHWDRFMQEKQEMHEKQQKAKGKPNELKTPNKKALGLLGYYYFKSESSHQNV